MKEHAITVARTARFFTLGESSDLLRQVWFVCHGYGQLASHFLKNFGAIASDDRLIVAPEGLSRFYWQGFSGRVGASWMTREDRLNEISDYVNFLDRVYHKIFESVSRDSVKVFALGFSQGTATVSRWTASGASRIDHLILWGGLLPPDLDLTATRNIFQRMTLTFVFGQHDAFAEQQKRQETENRLREFEIDFDVISFDGGHEMHVAALNQLGEKFVNQENR